MNRDQLVKVTTVFEKHEMIVDVRTGCKSVCVLRGSVVWTVFEIVRKECSSF